jgi:hypothetical protein
MPKECPKSADFLKFEKLKPLAEHYGCEMDSFAAEVKLFPIVLYKEKISNCVEEIQATN